MYDASREMQNSNNVSTNIELFLLRKAEKSEVNIFSLGADSDLQADLLNIFNYQTPPFVYRSLFKSEPI